MTTDIAAIETMWNEYHAGLYTYVFKRLRDHDTASDLLSTIYLRAVVAIRNGNGPTTHAHGWLFAIARNVLNDHWRAKKHTYFVEWETLPDCVDECADPDTLVTRQMEAERVRHAVARLPESQATVVVWRLQGYETEEIAAGLGRTYGATKAVIARGYANLRERLGEAA